MVKQKRSRQTWWPLYALGLLIIGLLILAHRLAPSPGWRTFLEIGVVVIGYGLIALWLETQSNVLQFRPSGEVDSPAVKSPGLEIPSLPPSHLRYYFYVGSDPLIIYGEPEPSTGNLHLNGHGHPARTILSLPEEAAE